MTIFEDATVTVAIADYAGVDGMGKVNAIGLGFTITPVAANGFSAPMYVVGLIDAPPRHAGLSAHITLELRNLTDDVLVEASGPSGATEALRITNEMKFDRAQVSGMVLGADMPVRVQLAIGFPQGLPLLPGKTYGWKLRIDDQSRRSWRAVFHVPSLPVGPIFGGPAGPADIPQIQSLATDTVEPEDD